jgi:hypothetical protein
MSFLNLTPELRNKIYHYLVVSNEFSIDGIDTVIQKSLQHALKSRRRLAAASTLATYLVYFSVPHNTPWLPAFENGGAYLICPQERLSPSAKVTLSCLSRL